ncbi:MAG: ATP-dependent DNA helicase RecG [Actinomycetaceae bacterium]|nr:ATP-dependent DNA helicase RecG [Actinomycetaceae bacterium]
MAGEAVASDGWTALSRPLERALGKRTANALAKIGLQTVGDLVFHAPFRLAHRGELMPISQVREGEAVTVVARVLDATMRPMNARRGHILTVRIADGIHELALTFFGKNSRALEYHERRLAPGVVASFSGKISSYRGALQLAHPQYELVDDEGDLSKLDRPIPIYHASEKLASWHIQRAIETVLPSLTEADLPDPLPPDYRRSNALPERLEAIGTLHAPDDEASWRRARARMIHEEAFVLQAALAVRSTRARERSSGAYPAKADGLVAQFDEHLPFELTRGQIAVGREISRDLARTAPMQRLLQGDVGSGKTVVALRAMLQVLDAGGQAALLAPTEVLAHQHVRTIEALLGPLAPVELLTGSMTVAQRRRALARIASGQAGLIVGTHALLSEAVQIPFLGLAVIDEQHRFGVDQRDALASGVHTLVMTATPIPRTIAMTAFGDLDVSTLRELPAGRAGVSTTVVPASKQAWMDRVWQRVAEEVRAGGRAYVVCPRIEDEGDTPMASVLAVAERLRDEPALNGLAVGILHGRMDPEEKAAAMERFVGGQEPVLVATTVIEVGVDVAQATVMVVLDADRFGLSQLHQLRGRIGRGTMPGVCLAITGADEASLAMRRLAAFASTTDGFALAEQDLALRSEGDVLGANQAGRGSHLRFLSVSRHRDVIEIARQAARALVEDDPQLVRHAELSAAVAQLDEGRAGYLERG